MKFILTLVLANLFAWPVVSLPAKAIPTYTSVWSNSSTTRIEPVPLESSTLELTSSSLAITTTSSILTTSDLQPCTTTIHQTYADDGIMQKVSTADESGSCLYTTYIASSAGPTIESLVSFIAESTATASPYSSSMVGPVRESSTALTTAVSTTSFPFTSSENTKSSLTSLSSPTTSNKFTTILSSTSSLKTLNTSCTAQIYGDDVGNNSYSYTTYSASYHCASTVTVLVSPTFQTLDTDNALSEVDPARTSEASDSSTDSTTILHSTDVPKSTKAAPAGSYTGLTASQSTDSVMATVETPLTLPTATATGASSNSALCTGILMYNSPVVYATYLPVIACSATTYSTSTVTGITSAGGVFLQPPQSVEAELLGPYYSLVGYASTTTAADSPGGLMVGIMTTSSNKPSSSVTGISSSTATKSKDSHALIPPPQLMETGLLATTVPISTSTTASSASTSTYATDCASPPCTTIVSPMQQTPASDLISSSKSTAASSSSSTYATDCASPPCTTIVSPMQQTPASDLIDSSTSPTSVSLHTDPASNNGAKTLEVPSTTSTKSASSFSMTDAASGSETSTSIPPIITAPTTISSIVLTEENGSLTTVPELVGTTTAEGFLSLVMTYGSLTVNGAPVVATPEGVLVETSSTSGIASTTDDSTTTSIHPKPLDQSMESRLADTTSSAETTSSTKKIGTELALPVPGLIATQTSEIQVTLSSTVANGNTLPTTTSDLTDSPTAQPTSSTSVSAQDTATNLIEPTTTTPTLKGPALVPSTTELETSITSPIVLSLGSTSVTVKPIIVSETTAPPAVISLEDTSVTANSASQFVVSSQTLTQGGAITVSGSQGVTTISLASAATAAVVNGETQPLPTAVVTSNSKQGPTTSTPISAIIVDSSTVTENSASEFVIGSQTLKSDSPITVTDSQGTTTFSLAHSNTAVVVNGATSEITSVEINASPTPAVVTIGSSAYTQNSASAFVVGSQTLSQGSDITVAGTTVSLASAATAIVVNGVTSAIPTPTAESSQQSVEQDTPQEITIGSSVITAISTSDVFVVGSQTLVPGAQITVSGTTISLASSASAVVVNGATSSIAVPAQGSANKNSDSIPQTASEYVVAGQTLAPGNAITVEGSTLSLASSGTGIVINGLTSAFPTPSTIPIPIPHEINIGSSVVTENPASNFVIASQTLAPGSQITVSGTTISLAQSATAVVVNGVTSNLPIPATTPLPEITIGSSVLTADSASEFVFANQTLTPGFHITVSGTTISLAPSANAIVINGQTSHITTDTEAPTTSVAPEIRVGSSIITANTASEFIVASQTLSPGSQITVSGTTFSLAPSASAIVINGQTSQIATYTKAPTASVVPEITVGSSVLTANTASEFIVASQTLSPGSAITVSGTTFSLAPSITAVVINGKTTPISTAPSTTPEIVLGSSTFTENPASAFIIAGQTLTPGETITASSTTIAFLPSGNGVVVNGATSTFVTAPAVTSPPEVLTVGSQLYTATSGAFVLDGQTLSDGGVVVVSGTVVSLGPSGAVIGVMSTLSTEVFGETGSASKTLATGPSYTDSLATATATGKNGSASGRCYNMLFLWISVILGGLMLF